MKKLMTALAGTLLLLCACNKKDSVTYSGLEAGFLQSSLFTTDNGVKMNIVGNDLKLDVTSARRVLVSYETHPVTDAGRIDIDLLGLWEAGILTPASAGALGDVPDGDPVQVTDAWFNGGYLNVLASYEGKDPSKHKLSAVYMADENGIIIRLRHADIEASDDGTQVENVFLSIPMDEPVLSFDQSNQAVGKKPAYPVSVLFQWTWYTLESGPLMLYEKKGSFTPES